MTSVESPAVGLSTRPTAGPNRYVPKHGTQSRYRGSRHGSWPPCHCELCTAANTRSCKKRAIDHMEGRPPRYPNGPVVEHIKMLNAAGMKNEVIARAARVSPSTIRYAVNGLTKSCLREKALRILAVKPGQVDERADRLVVGCRRRLQALYALGHNPDGISAVSGLCRSAVSAIANGHTQWVDAPTERAVHQAYAELRDGRGPSAKTSGIAERRGWRDPLWWDDMGDIDDPSFDPDAADRVLNVRELGALRRTEIEHLSSYGYGAEEIAARLEMAYGSVRDIMRELQSGRGRDRRRGVAA